VTKPIEQGLKKIDLPKQAKVEKIEKAGASKPRSSPPLADPRAEAEIMQLTPRKRKPAAPPEVIVQIGQQLGKVYKDILEQPVPDRFLDLLQALETGTQPAPKCQQGRADAPAKMASNEPHAAERKRS
jgi:hypothetical protein